MHCTIIYLLITIKGSLGVFLLLLKLACVHVFLLLLKLTSMAGSLGLGEGLGS
jgi:hypothetical protein